METIELYGGLFLINYDGEYRFELCTYQCSMLPNGMFKLLDNKTAPKDAEHVTTAIHPNLLNKKIYLDSSKYNIRRFVYYSLDKDDVLLTFLKAKETYIDLHKTLIEQRKAEIETLQKQIDKYTKKMDRMENEFSIRSVDSLNFK